MKNIEDIIMTRDRLMGPTFTILNEMWTDLLRFCNVGGGVDTPPHTHTYTLICAPAWYPLTKVLFQGTMLKMQTK